MKKALLVLTLATFAAAVYAGDPVEVWNEAYDSGESDMGQSVAVDAEANVYVTGITFNGTDSDYLTIKYNSDGDTLWTRTFDGGNGEDQPYGIAVDAEANVYVAGGSNNGTDYDWRTIKYDTDGNIGWNVPYDGGNGDDWGFGVAVDASGNPLVTGYSFNGTDDDCRTIKYDSDGNILWNVSYDGGNGDVGRSVAVDDAANVYVTGWSGNGIDNDYRTIKYDSEGSLQWNKVYDSGDDDYARGVAVDAEANVYVTGRSHNGTDDDYRTIKYDTLGNIEWNEVYDVGIGGDDYGRGIAVDPYFVYITGQTFQGTRSYCRTIRYDKEGNEDWNVFFDSGDNASGSGVAVDDSGYVYVTGWPNNGNDWDFRTIKYQQDDYPAVSEQPSSLSSISLEVIDNLTAAPTIRYSLPAGQYGTLTFYSADGRKLESYTLDPTQPDFSWTTDNPSGVYFARLVIAHQSVTVKTILAR